MLIPCLPISKVRGLTSFSKCWSTMFGRRIIFCLILCSPERPNKTWAEHTNNNSEITGNYDFLKLIDSLLENSCSKLSKGFKENIYG